MGPFGVVVADELVYLDLRGACTSDWMVWVAGSRASLQANALARIKVELIFGRVWATFFFASLLKLSFLPLSVVLCHVPIYLLLRAALTSLRIDLTTCEET